MSFGAPASPFLFTAGAAFSFAENMLGLLCGFTVSLLISHFWANRLFRRQLERFLAAKAPPWAAAVLQKPALAIILVRMTPGVPYVVQNCFLAPICPSRTLFLVCSLPPLMIMAVLLLKLGAGFMAGNYWLCFALVLVLAAIGFAFKWHWQRQKRGAQG